MTDVKLFEEVSVSLRSIIHSYLEVKFMDSTIVVLCFRLLTEYHSFLFSFLAPSLPIILLLKVSVSLRSIIHSYIKIKTNVIFIELSFRLLTEYHSFLLKS